MKGCFVFHNNNACARFAHALQPFMASNPALCCKLSVDAQANFQSAGWLISFSLDRNALFRPALVFHHGLGAAIDRLYFCANLRPLRLRGAWRGLSLLPIPVMAHVVYATVA